MRLNKEEINTLKTALHRLDADAKLYLFGSRVFDAKKGGDIDLLIISRKLDKKQVRLLRHKFFEKFGEQKIDIVVNDGNMGDAFVKRIFPQAVPL